MEFPEKVFFAFPLAGDIFQIIPGDQVGVVRPGAGGVAAGGKGADPAYLGVTPADIYSRCRSSRTNIPDLLASIAGCY